MKRAKCYDRALVWLTLGFLFLFGTLLLVCPQKKLSESENRALRTWEASSWQGLLDGSLSETVSVVTRDQFPMRECWVSFKARCEQALGKRENNGVLLGADGYLMARDEYVDLSIAKENLRAAEGFSKAWESPVTSVWVPRSCDVMARWLPDQYPSDAARRLFELLNETPHSFLQAKAEEKTKIYYRTDHHLTTEGAYFLYCELGARLGYVPRAHEEFSVETVSEQFFGSADSAVGGIASRADRIELYRYEGDERFLVTDGETGEIREGFYDASALEHKDQYAVFLGGNFAHLSVKETRGIEKPKLLLIKDSFANALIPFLAIHFDLEIIDLRYVAGEIFVDACDRVLILQGVDTLATDRSLGKLALIKKKG